MLPRRVCIRITKEVSRRTVSRFNFSTSSRSLAGLDESSDVLIVGGGAVGCALANQIALKLPSLSVDLVEAGPGPQGIQSDYPHPRSYALSPTSLKLLGLRGNNRLGYYSCMQIWEASQPATLHFDRKDISAEFLGAVVEDSVILDHLWKHVSTKCMVRTNTRVSSIRDLTRDSLVQVELKHGNGDEYSITTHQTRLLVAADGVNSQVRKLAGIENAVVDYGQTALTFTVKVDRQMEGRCYQRFLPSGPLALLPTFSPEHAIIVWSTTPDEVQKWKDNEELAQQVNEFLQQGPGTLDSLFPSPSSFPRPFRNLMFGIERLVETLPYGVTMAAQEQTPFHVPPRILEIASPQFSFPLAMRNASTYVKPRLALVGDAAHTVHPMAGQGLNLGLQDVASLVRLLETAVGAGMDASVLLHEYEASRKLQVTATLAGLHALQRAFGSQHVVGKYLKALGMSMVQVVPPVRQAFVHAACSGIGSENGAIA